MIDCELGHCELANLDATRASLIRVVVEDSRATGLAFGEAALQDVVFRDCRIDLASFRFARLERVAFDGCVLREADFQEARCEAVAFQDCDLSGASFSGTSFADSEVCRCRLEGIRGIEGLRGVALEWDAILGLAPELAAALGIRLLDG